MTGPAPATWFKVGDKVRRRRGYGQLVFTVTRVDARDDGDHIFDLYRIETPLDHHRAFAFGYELVPEGELDGGQS